MTRVREIASVSAAVAAGLVGTVVALGDRGADAQFLQDQRHPQSLQGTDVAAVVRTAPNPRTGQGSGASATCVRRGRGELGNPWACTVTYPDGRKVRMSVNVNSDGSYVGRYAGTNSGATGCCVDVPGAR
jgi:hypothetical protein